MEIIAEHITEPKALLIGVDIGEFDSESSMKELCELAHTAGVEPVITAIQKR